MWSKSRSRQFKSSGKLQIEELVHASRVTVFFIDDKQSVRPDEIGSADYVINYATKTGSRLFDYKLEAQFRCAGSVGFVNWIENTLEIERTANVLWNGHDKFEFGIVDSPEALDKIVRSKLEAGNSARLMAGFCWGWSAPLQDGSLVEDVVVGDFKRPWNAMPGRVRLRRGYRRHPYGRTIRAVSTRSGVFIRRKVLNSTMPGLSSGWIWFTDPDRVGLVSPSIHMTPSSNAPKPPSWTWSKTPTACYSPVQ